MDRAGAEYDRALKIADSSAISSAVRDVREASRLIADFTDGESLEDYRADRQDRTTCHERTTAQMLNSQAEKMSCASWLSRKPNRASPSWWRKLPAGKTWSSPQMTGQRSSSFLSKPPSRVAGDGGVELREALRVAGGVAVSHDIQLRDSSLQASENPAVEILIGEEAQHADVASQRRRLCSRSLRPSEGKRCLNSSWTDRAFSRCRSR